MLISENSAIWYKGWVWYHEGLASSHLGEKFPRTRNISYKRLSNQKWLVFDGEALYLVLSTEQAKAALKAIRDPQGQPVPAEDQAAVEAQFLRVLQRQRG